MIEVYKTDVADKDHAYMLINEIHEMFHHCRANFDLDDCDRILRVSGIANDSEAYQIISLLKSFGNSAEILPGDDPDSGELEYAHQDELLNR